MKWLADATLISLFERVYMLLTPSNAYQSIKSSFFGNSPQHYGRIEMDQHFFHAIEML